jgi:hypothetical protein
MVNTEHKQKQLLSIGFILSIFLLLLNDFYLKAVSPGLITGKLSDFAGLFALPFFISIFFQSKKQKIYVIVGLGFILWKLPITDNVIEFWNQHMFYSIQRVVDYTDYVALLILPLSYYYRPSINCFLFARKTISFGVVFLAIFSFLATAGTHGKIKGYKLENSKYEVNNAMKIFFQTYPDYKVPKVFESHTWHYGGTRPNQPSKDNWIHIANADSVNFHFFLREYNMIIWTSFSGNENDWRQKPLELALISTIVPGEKVRLDKGLNKDERKNLTAYFENEILFKLKNILGNEEKR